jgi:hypothetical protein
MTSSRKLNKGRHITRTIKVIEPVTGYRLPVTGLTPFIAGPLADIIVTN